MNISSLRIAPVARPLVDDVCEHVNERTLLESKKESVLFILVTKNLFNKLMEPRWK